jgi:hypothetical protein
MSDPNVVISGDEARLLMVSLMNCDQPAPARAVLSLYLRLAEVSQVQPPLQKESTDETE